MNFCPYCGKRLMSECVFCPYCGQKLHTADESDALSVIGQYDIESLAAENAARPRARRPMAYGSSDAQLSAEETIGILERQCHILQSFVEKADNSHFYVGLYEGLAGIAVRLRSASSVQFSKAEAGLIKQYYGFLLGCVDCLVKTGQDRFEEQIDEWLNDLKSVSRILDYIDISGPAAEQVHGPEVSPSAPEDISPEVRHEIESLEMELREFGPTVKRSAFDSSVDYREELRKLVGLESVKRQVEHFIQDFRLQEKRRKEHPDLKAVVSMNFIFKGKPGTGKTTVARLIAGILKSEGIVENGCCVETDASSLVSAYVGVPSKITRLAALQAIGGVLFIDEAYSLMNHKGGKADVGAEIIDTLTPLMENYRDRLIVILAGYNDEMDKFLASSNTGFPSRFKSIIDFEDYNADEMMSIFLKMSGTEHYVLEENAERRLYALLQYIHSRKDTCRTFANARTVRSLYETVRGKASIRMSMEQNPDLDRILVDDVSLTADELKSIGAI